MIRLLDTLRLLALGALLALPLALAITAPAAAQSQGERNEIGAIAVVAPCQPGNITCYATQDANCRQSGGFLRLSMTMASAVTLECTPDRFRLDQVFAEERAQTNTCTAGHLCIRHGTRTGGDSNIYRQMVGMMNSCLGSNGRLEVHAIMADGPNTSTLYAGCLRRA